MLDDHAHALPDHTFLHHLANVGIGDHTLDIHPAAHVAEGLADTVGHIPKVGSVFEFLEFVLKGAEGLVDVHDGLVDIHQGAWSNPF